MNLIDVLEVYGIKHNTEDLFAMLQDYTLDTRIDRVVMNKVIIKELGAMTPYVTNTIVFKVALEEFFDKYKYNISKLLDTMYYDYEPLSNNNLQRIRNEAEDRKSEGNIDNTNEYETNVDTSFSGTTENQVSAYDVSTYQPKDKTIDNNTNNNDTKHKGEDKSKIISNVDTDKRLGEKITGKDGNTSYQELIEQERKLAKFNIFNWIIQQMRKELFLLVY